MTDHSGNVTAISGYTVGTTGDITEAQYTVFLGWAQAQVAEDDPGFTGSQTEEATALLICHYIARRKGKSGKVSETISKYSYSRAGDGLTSWLSDYQDLIKKARRVNGTYLVKVNP